MSTTKKVLLVLALSLLLVVMVFSGVVAYIYTHPETVKPLVENSLSSVTGGDCSIQALDYTLRPLSLTVEGVSIVSETPEVSFSFNLPVLKATMLREGTFGRQTLVIQDLQLNDLTYHLTSPNGILPSLAAPKKTSSGLGRLTGWVVRFLLFRDVLLQRVQMQNGQIKAQFRDQHYRAETIALALSRNQTAQITGKVEIGLGDPQLAIRIPTLEITSGGPLTLSESPIAFNLSADHIIVKNPHAQVNRMSLAARCLYTNRPARLSVETLSLKADDLSAIKDSALMQRLNLANAGAQQMHLAAQLDYAATTGMIHLKAFTFDITDLALAPTPSKQRTTLGLRLTADGKFDMGTSQLEIGAFDLSAKGNLAFNGSIKAAFKDQHTLQIRIDDGHVFPEKLRQWLPAEWVRSLDPLRLEDRIKLSGWVEGVRAAKVDWTWRCDVETQFNQNGYRFSAPDATLEGRLVGGVNASGPFNALNVSGRIESQQTQASGAGIRPSPFSAAVEFKGAYPVFAINQIDVAVPQVEIRAGERKLAIAEIKIRAVQGRVDAARQSLELPEVIIESGLLQNLKARFTLNGRQISLHIDGRDTRWLGSLIDLNLLPGQWQAAGEDELKLSAVSDDGRLWRIDASAQLRNAAFENDDGTILGEAVNLDVAGRGNFSLDRAQTNIDLTIDAGAGEVLFDRFYLNLNDNGISYRGKLRYDTRNAVMWLNDQHLALKDILGVNFSSRIDVTPSKRHFAINLELEETPLQPIFQSLVAEPFGGEHPFLASLATKGSIGAAIDLKWGIDGWQVQGRCAWRKGEIVTNDDTLALEGVTLDFPIWYHTLPKAPQENRLTGRLDVQTVKLPLLPIQPLALPLQAGPNRMTITFSEPIQVPGGRVRIGTLTARDVLTPNRSITTRVVVDRVELAPLLSKLWGRPIEGAINGTLDPITYQGQHFEAHGELIATIFGGQIRIAKMGALNLFSGAPVWQLSSQWNDLRLAEMTRDTAFGKIEGLLYGYANDIEITYGEPQRFDLLLETKPQKGIKQKISVLAVDNIAQLGGGQSPFVGLAGIVTAFLKEFPYKKIGVRAALQNDAFRVNGTIRQDGIEYLVKRSGLSGVDVINQNPDNRVSFKDMVKRIKRIKARKGPVVE